MEPEQIDEAAELELIRSRLCAAAGQMASAQCWWLDLVAECDERGAWFGYGTRDCAHWIAYSCSMSPGTAREHVRVARALKKMPLFHTEFAAGRVSYSKVREATRIIDEVDESTLLSLAKTCTASQFERTVRGYRRTDRGRLEQEKRRKARWFTDDDGMVVLTARLPAEEGAVLIAALEMGMAQLSAEQVGNEAPSVSCADAFVHVAESFLANSKADLSGEDRHLVVVHVDARHLTGGGDTQLALDPSDPTAVPTTGACEIAGVGGISPNTAQRLACDAMVVAMIRGAGGAVLAHGRKRRLVSPQQRRALMVRDGVCQFPGCARSTHLEAHHVRPWAAGGKTDLGNLVLLCRLHHMAVHDAGFGIAQALTSTPQHPRWFFTDPAGCPLAERRAAPNPQYPSAFPLSRDLDHITSWTDADAEHIRPRWSGEPVHITNIVAALQDNPRAAAA